MYYLAISLLLLLANSSETIFSQTDDNNPSTEVAALIPFDVSVGISNDELEAKFPNAEFREVDAWEYGIDGGGTGIEVVENDSILLFYWLHYETELVNGIILVSPLYSVDGDVHVGMKLSEFLMKYPKNQSYVSLMTDDEHLYNQNLDYSIQLESTEDDRAAEYNFENGESEFIRYIDTDKTVKRICIY
jgi:hypothetical protein